MKIYCRRTQQGFVPLYESDYEVLKRLKEGAEVLVEVKQERNTKFHKKFFALLRLTLDNLPERIIAEYHLYGVEDLLIIIKYLLGYAELVKVGNWQYLSPRSIAFSKMTEQEFSDFYARAVQLIIHTFLPGMTTEDIENEIYRFM